jgi:hypothetical protein
MGKGIIIGNSGGTYSEDVTATKADVLVGKTALTSDSNDEAVEGAMQLLKTDNFDVPFYRLAHQRADDIGQGVVIDSPGHGRGLAISVKPPDGKKYALDNNTELVFKPEPDLRPENIRGDKRIANIQGGIPIWNPARSGYLDMVYAWGNEGHYIDHPIAGRGVVLKIGNGYLIENANWVYLAEPDLIAANVRAGVNMFGVQGEMVDYGAGGMAFNGATFDNRLMSGVADKGKEIVMSRVWATGNMSFLNDQSFTNWNVWSYKFMGIRDGGIRFSVSDRNRQGVGKASIATFFDRSINLTPFRKVKVGAKFLSGKYKKSSTQNDRATATVGVVFVNKNNLTLSNNSQYKYQTILNASYKGKHISFQDGAEQEEVHEHGRLTGRQLWAEVDVSDINEHCFAFAYARADAGDYYAEAEMIINHIEFIN